MYANQLPFPADRMVPTASPVPQFAVQYPEPTNWQAYIPMITQTCATIIGNNATKNSLRCFSYNLFSSNNWQNEPFVNLVIFAIDYLNYVGETNQVQGDLNTTIQQVCEQVVKCISVMNLNSYPALQSMVQPMDLQAAQGAMGEFNQMRQLVQNHRAQRGMQMQAMQPQMPGMMPGMQPPMMGMQQPMGNVQMGGDPRFNAGSHMAVMPGMQRPGMMPQAGVRTGMPGMFNPYAAGNPADARDMQKAMITMQRETMGGGGRWNKATDETLDQYRGAQQIVGGGTVMGNAFDRRMTEIATGTTPTQHVTPIAAAVQSPITPQTESAPAMNTSDFQYPEGYFRNRELDEPDERAMNMANFKRAVAIGALPPDALSPYDAPPARPAAVLQEVRETVSQPVAAAPVKATPREPAEQEADTAKPSMTPSSSTNVAGSAQAASGRWWDQDDEENRIPDVIAPTIEIAAEVPAAVTEKLVEQEAEPQPISPDDDYSYEEESRIHRWVPHAGQWYKQLYHPSRQVSMLKVFRDGRANEQVILDRAPEDIPNMDYANHVLNTPAGRRVAQHAEADRLLAAHEKIKAATDAYYSGPPKGEGGTDAILDNPITSFEAHLVTEAEGAEATVWTLNTLRRAMREKEQGQPIDIFVTNALLYEAVYCPNDADAEFLKAVYRLTTFTELQQHLGNHREDVSKALWELVNKRATAMLNQSLVLSMSLNEDVLAMDFFADQPGVDSGIQQSPDVVKTAWKSLQLRQLRMFFHEADEADMQRNTDSLAYFLSEDNEAYLKATRYLSSLFTMTQLSVDAADLDIALEPHDVAQITDTATPVLYRVVSAIFDSTIELGNKHRMGHLIRTQDGIVYQLSFGALADDALLITRRQSLWVDAR